MKVTYQPTRMLWHPDFAHDIGQRVDVFLDGKYAGNLIGRTRGAQTCAWLSDRLGLPAHSPLTAPTIEELKPVVERAFA